MKMASSVFKCRQFDKINAKKMYITLIGHIQKYCHICACSIYSFVVEEVFY